MRSRLPILLQAKWARHWTRAQLLSTRLPPLAAILHLSATPIEWCTLCDMFPILARYGAYFLLSKSQGRCQLPEEAQVTAFGYFSPGLLSPSRFADRGSCGLQSRRLSCGQPRGIFCLVFSAPRGDLRRTRILSGTQVPFRAVTDWHFEGSPLRHASLDASSQDVSCGAGRMAGRVTRGTSRS
ncbi:uncharacterized protein SCHCODRAFT_02715082 [Schizophyllum commune H4-8]|uniref:uncharacterized protein n=1 Tax=Schizophyllum commune (strain H4-8 / FGSC 9210) TaxID=578458 RepID=UPI00215EC81B|nr:uncharacterized protein SCHCODRAFT_02715082 [Schizophyllum commune H4-8]KAI5886995.1 hypothetical protein SCHCODRAFT_02715082 [Schizophyllum commune H4-8]